MEMTKEQVFQLKLSSLQLATGDIDKAKGIYSWLIEGTPEAVKEAVQQAEAQALAE